MRLSSRTNQRTTVVAAHGELAVACNACFSLSEHLLDLLPASALCLVVAHPAHSIGRRLGHTPLASRRFLFPSEPALTELLLNGYAWQAPLTGTPPMVLGSSNRDSRLVSNGLFESRSSAIYRVRTIDTLFDNEPQALLYLDDAEHAAQLFAGAKAFLSRSKPGIVFRVYSRRKDSIGAARELIRALQNQHYELHDTRGTRIADGESVDVPAAVPYEEFIAVPAESRWLAELVSRIPPHTAGNVEFCQARNTTPCDEQLVRTGLLPARINGSACMRLSFGTVARVILPACRAGRVRLSVQLAMDSGAALPSTLHVFSGGREALLKPAARADHELQGVIDVPRNNFEGLLRFDLLAEKPPKDEGAKGLLLNSFTVEYR